MPCRARTRLPCVQRRFVRPAALFAAIPGRTRASRFELLDTIRSGKSEHFSWHVQFLRIPTRLARRSSRLSRQDVRPSAYRAREAGQVPMSAFTQPPLRRGFLFARARSHLSKRVQEPFRSWHVVVVIVEREHDSLRVSYDLLARNESVESGIGAIVSVVTQHQITVLRNGNRAKRAE